MIFSKKNLSFISIAFFTLGYTFCKAQQNSQSSRKSVHAATIGYQNLDYKIKQWQNDLNVPNVGVVIIDKGKVVKAQVFGYDRNGRPAPQDMLFEVASVTKVVFTTLVLKFVNEGKWDLDEPLFHYYTDPDVASNPYSKELTTRQVLSQQSGFDNWRWMNASGKLTFNFKPGTKFNYSGEGFEYLKAAIENKFHESLAKLSDSLLFRLRHD